MRLEDIKPGDKLLRVDTTWGSVSPGMVVEVSEINGEDLVLVGHSGHYAAKRFIPVTLEYIEQLIKKEIGLK